MIRERWIDLLTSIFPAYFVFHFISNIGSQWCVKRSRKHVFRDDCLGMHLLVNQMIILRILLRFGKFSFSIKQTNKYYIWSILATNNQHNFMPSLVNVWRIVLWVVWLFDCFFLSLFTCLILRVCVCYSVCHEVKSYK